MEKSYQPHAIEQRWYDTWERAGYFRPSGRGEPYCIMLPPPNVTGSLHMGHAFQDTLMDALIRYHRMSADNTLWQGGTDHAGIATQMVVERQLAAQGASRTALGREAFVEQVWRWKVESGGTITRQLRRLGASIDWSRERFTLDDGLSRAVREVFVRLYEEGLIYRGKRLVNWDPVLHTAVSDLEVHSQEEQGHLWHIRYPLVAGPGHLVVATTRPETLLGDAAVAVHPEDLRYAHLIGHHVELPLTGRTVPIIADEYVEREFGTGCVKITPAHDFNDYQVWLRHREEDYLRAQPHGGLIDIFTADARLKASPSEEAGHTEDGLADASVAHLIPARYRGLDRFEARARIVADLEAAGLLEKTEPYKLTVPRGDRSHAVLEPRLTDQWYVRVAPLAEEAVRAVQDGRIRFVPESWAKTYFEWMRNIQDWCISRQIWWGHRIPAWYDEAGREYVGHSEEDVREKHRLGSGVALTQDPDVLDTWFSSALWPFSTLGWPEATEELKTFYPGSVLVTGFDIIFFWVARMIMMGLKFARDVPFREVYIHGLVRDAEGQKMSKSKGNVLDPIDLIDGIDLDSLIAKRTSGLMQPDMARRIEQATRKHFPQGIPAYGTDALRFTFAALAATGRDIKFDLGRIEGYRNFCNKLWNAARYVFMNTEGKETGGEDTGGKETGLTGEVELCLADRWIASRLQRTTREVTEALRSYRFDLAAQALYEFTWNEYCDWYLELSKPVLVSEDSRPAALRGTRRTLVQVLETLLRLLHPIMPFITEELWRRAAPLAGIQGETVMLQPYPVSQAALIDADAELEMEWLQRFIVGIRTVRAEMNLSPGRAVPLLLQHGAEQDRPRVDRHRPFLTRLARLSSIAWLPRDAVPPPSVTALAGELTLFIPMAGLVDKEPELARLGKEIAKTRKDLEKSEAKLANPAYTERAPAEVVEKERQRVAELRSALEKLSQQHERIAAL